MIRNLLFPYLGWLEYYVIIMRHINESELKTEGFSYNGFALYSCIELINSIKWFAREEQQMWATGLF